MEKYLYLLNFSNTIAYALEHGMQKDAIGKILILHFKIADIKGRANNDPFFIQSQKKCRIYIVIFFMKLANIVNTGRVIGVNLPSSMYTRILLLNYG
jgi:hypothetical protein